MLTNDSPYREEFHSLLDRIREEVDSLKGEIRELKKENSQLRDKLEQIQDGQTDIFSALTESERIAMRNRVSGLIDKIDHHLENGEQ